MIREATRYPRLGRSLALPRRREITPLPPRFALKYFALERPFLGLGDQACSHRIIDHVEAFCFRALAGPKSMMKTTRLPAKRRVTDGVRKSRFPVMNPSIEVPRQNPGPREKVKMVRHQNVRTSFPIIRRPPDRCQDPVNRRVRQPRTRPMPGISRCPSHHVAFTDSSTRGKPWALYTIRKNGGYLERIA